MKKVTIYTDGSSLGNPGFGGFAAILIYQGKVKEISEGKANVTNNQMELQAAIAALKLLKEPCQIELYTDSEYLRKGITEWIKNWIRNGWKNSQKQPVKNADLWRELDLLVTPHQISWYWVKAHNGNEFNERVDILARDAARKLRQS